MYKVLSDLLAHLDGCLHQSILCYTAAHLRAGLTGVVRGARRPTADEVHRRALLEHIDELVAEVVKAARRAIATEGDGGGLRQTANGQEGEAGGVQGRPWAG